MDPVYVRGVNNSVSCVQCQQSKARCIPMAGYRCRECLARGLDCVYEKQSEAARAAEVRSIKEQQYRAATRGSWHSAGSFVYDPDVPESQKHARVSSVVGTQYDEISTTVLTSLKQDSHACPDVLDTSSEGRLRRGSDNPHAPPKATDDSNQQQKSPVRETVEQDVFEHTFPPFSAHPIPFSPPLSEPGSRSAYQSPFTGQNHQSRRMAINDNRAHPFNHATSYPPPQNQIAMVSPVGSPPMAINNSQESVQPPPSRPWAEHRSPEASREPAQRSPILESPQQPVTPQRRGSSKSMASPATRKKRPKVTATNTPAKRSTPFHTAGICAQHLSNSTAPALTHPQWHATILAVRLAGRPGSRPFRLCDCLTPLTLLELILSAFKLPVQDLDAMNVYFAWLPLGDAARVTTLMSVEGFLLLRGMLVGDLPRVVARWDWGQYLVEVELVVKGMLKGGLESGPGSGANGGGG